MLAEGFRAAVFSIVFLILVLTFPSTLACSNAFSNSFIILSNSSFPSYLSAFAIISFNFDAASALLEAPKLSSLEVTSVLKVFPVLFKNSVVPLKVATPVIKDSMPFPLAP